VVLLHAILKDGEARRKESQGRALPFIRPSVMLIMHPLQHALNHYRQPVRHKWPRRPRPLRIPPTILAGGGSTSLSHRRPRAR